MEKHYKKGEEKNQMSSINMNFENNDFWTMNTEQTQDYVADHWVEAQNTLETMFYRERRYHLRRLDHLNKQVVPLFIAKAHLDLVHTGPHYRHEVERYLQDLVLHRGLRRMIWRRLLIKDPWIQSGGPSFSAEEDVALNTEVFSSLLGLPELVQWATDPSSPTDE
ncbi:hypothetical protein [Absidia glauca]|uniref:Uncharacterized protein n=1 Tax=Absidia glauca TaxID=4829 RepID=A0A168ST18_ABSGL|nr:hypothetical protein [Absidia glauca]